METHFEQTEFRVTLLGDVVETARIKANMLIQEDRDRTRRTKKCRDLYCQELRIAMWRDSVNLQIKQTLHDEGRDDLADRIEVPELRYYAFDELMSKTSSGLLKHKGKYVDDVVNYIGGYGPMHKTADVLGPPCPRYPTDFYILYRSDNKEVIGTPYVFSPLYDKSRPPSCVKKRLIPWRLIPRRQYIERGCKE